MSLSISPAKMEDSIQLFAKELFGLAWGFQVNPSSCGNHEHYENYIRFNALTDRACGRGTTHVFVRNDNGKNRILGFITLRASSYIKTYDGVLQGYPALEILELAVAADAEKQGIGTELMKFAFTTALDLNAVTLGIQYILLCADKNAVTFYQRFGFECVESHGSVPRDGWNVECTPMFIKLPDLT